MADALLENPRTVRCARCAHEWTAEPLSEDQSLQPNSDQLAETDQEGTKPRARAGFGVVRIGSRPRGYAAVRDRTARRSVGPLREHAAARPISDRRMRHWSIAALAALGVAGYTERDALMRQWPASKRLYATLGLLPVETKAPDPKGPDATPPR